MVKLNAEITNLFSTMIHIQEYQQLPPSSSSNLDTSLLLKPKCQSRLVLLSQFPCKSSFLESFTDCFPFAESRIAGRTKAQRPSAG
jgi:hypothetical protein